MSEPSAVSICSNALLLLGAEGISSFSEENTRTKIISNIWEYKSDRVLRLHPWNCATRRVILSPEATAPAFGPSSYFLLPGDWLRTLSVGVDGSPDEYAEEVTADGKNVIAMDGSVCYLRYIFKNENVATWDAMLVDVMTQVMIAALAYPITKSTTKQATEEDIVKMSLKTTRTINGQSKSPDVFGDSPMLSNRIR